MPFVSANYLNCPDAPLGKWVCAPGSTSGPFDDLPPQDLWKHPNYCGQCVSYVKHVCPTLPETGQWKKGAQVKGTPDIVPGTVIATFNSKDKYEGHAAIYVKQVAETEKKAYSEGVHVYDQYVYGKTPQKIATRVLKWGAARDVNNGDKFFIVELLAP